jgi:hypothetical protein
MPPFSDQVAMQFDFVTNLLSIYHGIVKSMSESQTTEVLGGTFTKNKYPYLKTHL